MGHTIPPCGFHYIFEPTIFGKLEQGMGNIFTGMLGQWDLPLIRVFVKNPVTKEMCEFDGVIDTGAADCLVNDDVIESLQINPFTIKNYAHPIDGIIPSKKFIVDISFIEREKQTLFAHVEVGQILYRDYPAQVIIGTTLLQNAKFSYDGVNKTFQIEF